MSDTAIATQPYNIFPAAGTNFAVHFSRMPELSFVAQEVILPTTSVTTAKQPVPGMVIHQAPDKIIYDALSVSFLIDEEYRAYRELYSWLVGITGAQDREKFVTGFLDSQANYLWTEGNKRKQFGRASSSTIVVTIVNGAKIPILKYVFSNARIVSLSGLTLDTTIADPNVPLKATAQFNFDFYEILEIRR